MLFPCVQTAPITQRFGENPADYKRFGLPGHNGIDFALPIGSPIFAASAGTISKIKTDPQGYGLYIVIDHDAGLSSLYAHLTFTTSKTGQSVSAGQIIAYSGSSGNSSGPHLHFEIRDKNRSFDSYHGAVNPEPYLNPNGKESVTAQTITDEYNKSYFALVMESLNVRDKPSTTDGMVIGRLPAAIVILVKKEIDNGNRWALIGPNMYAAVTYNGCTYLEKISETALQENASCPPPTL